MKAALTLFVALGASLLFSSSSFCTDCEEIVAKAIAARGGLEKIKASPNRKNFSGTISVGRS